MLDDQAGKVLTAVVACSDQREPEVETSDYLRLHESHSDLSRDTFAAQLDALLTAGYLTHARAKRDSAAEIVRDRYLIPTTRGRVEVRR